MTDHNHDERPTVLGSGLETTEPSITGIGVDARRRIGRDLRLLYGSVLDQPLPERFTRLIDELAADSGSRKGS
jgi:hypothetical protein